MNFDTFTIYGLLAALLQLVIIVGTILRVILTRHPPGSAFAWILLTTILPYIGFALYLMFGERPIGRLRARRLRETGKRWMTVAHQKLTPHGPLPYKLARHRTFIHLVTRLAGMPLATGSCVELHKTSEQTLRAIENDIKAAAKSVDMVFYIFSPQGRVLQVIDALIDAAARGVRVRILVDDFGSRAFLRSDARRRMETAGIEIASALPMRFLRFFGLQRADLRLHRKLVIIDRKIGYTGSFNMIDPAGYKDSGDVGEWVDAMVRLTGPAVLSLIGVWAFDWALQPDGDLSDLDNGEEVPFMPNCGQADTICIPSGPYQTEDVSLLLVLESIASAQSTLTVTTPYFIPNESVVAALKNAVLRGVDVRLIVPRRCDGALVNWAMRRYFDDLLAGGVKIYLYDAGMLHTKSISIDGEVGIFGTLNIDNRSMHLNFELMMAIFDRQFVADLDSLTTDYMRKSSLLDPIRWRKRPLSNRLKEGASYLVSPLL